MVGYFLSTETKAQSPAAAEPIIDVGRTLPDDLPDHFPRNIVVIDEEGKVHPVPVAVVDDMKKYPDKFFTQSREDNKIIFKIELPLLTVSKDGMLITAFCYLQEDFQQITEQLINHYNRPTWVKDNNRPTIQNMAWPDHFGSAAVPSGLRILKWRMQLKERTEE